VPWRSRPPRKTAGFEPLFGAKPNDRSIDSSTQTGKGSQIRLKGLHLFADKSIWNRPDFATPSMTLATHALPLATPADRGAAHRASVAGASEPIRQARPSVADRRP